MPRGVRGDRIIAAMAVLEHVKQMQLNHPRAGPWRPWLLSERERILAREKMTETAQHAKALSASLTGNRELLAKVRRFGFQKI